MGRALGSRAVFKKRQRVRGEGGRMSRPLSQGGGIGGERGQELEHVTCSTLNTGGTFSKGELRF